MIQNFWNWMFDTVNSALNTLNTLYNNSTLHPFFELLLVVVGIGVIIKFILSPLLGIGIIGGSDKAKENYQKKQRQKARDAKWSKAE